MSLKKFLVMVENDVAGEIVFDDDFEYNKRFYNALLNGGKVMEIDPNIPVGRDYIWDGTTFNPPE